MNPALAVALLAASCLSVALGIFLVLRPALAIEFQRRFYEKINWRMEPISLAKELRNTRLMGLMLVSIGIFAFMQLGLTGTTYRPAAEDSPQTYHLRAKTLIHRGRYRQAEILARRALRYDERFAKAYMDLGSAYTGLGEYIRADKAYQKALEYLGDDKNNLEIIYYDLGGVWERERNAAKAWRYFEKAYAMKSFLPEERYWKDDPQLLVSYVKKGDREGFARSLAQEKLFPAEVRARMKRMNRLLGTGRYQQVLEECRAYVADNPGSRYAPVFYGYEVSALGKQRKYAEALGALGKLNLSWLPEEEAAWFKHLYAYLLLRLGRYNEAFVYIYDLFRNHPEYGPSRQLYPLILEMVRKGADFPLQSQENAPARLKEMLAMAFYSARKFDRALEYAEDLIARHPDYKGYRDMLFSRAMLLREKGEGRRARALLEEFVAAYPADRNTPAAYMQLSQLYAEESDYGRSYEAFMHSQLALPVAAIGLLIIVLVGAAAVGIATLFFRFFFKTAYKAKITSPVFRRLDLYLFIVFSLGVPFLMQFFILYLYRHFNPLMSSLRIEPTLTSVLFGDLLIMCATYYLLKVRYGLDDETLGFVSRGFKANVLLPAAVTALTIAMAFFFMLCMYALGVKEINSPLEGVVRKVVNDGSPGQLWSLFIGVAVLGPICEEVIFRGYFFNFFKHYSSAWFAVFASAAVFSLAHNTPILLPYFFAMGVILAVIYAKTRTIIPCMVVHILYNLLVTLAAVAYA